jgi:hypothetical protein
MSCHHPELATPAVDEKLLMTNTSLEPEEQRPPKPVRIILPREVCTDPETAANAMYAELQRALKTLRGEEGGSDGRDESPSRRP